MFKKIKKPWGYEEILEINKKFMFKKLFMKKNNRCSLQYHNVKKELVYVVSGKLQVTIKKKKKNIYKILKKGENILISPKTIHRMKAITNCTYLEASTPEVDDVVRIEDDYKRVK
tara:strand:+ start:291 stop:635 length:345 start_codon:yes stop_codon:yes gene_type:complete